LTESNNDSSHQSKIKVVVDANNEYFGLSVGLWRLAIVTGIAQFSVSIWSWQFSIYIAGIVEEWQLGLIFSFGTLLTLVGYILAGTTADLFGRRATMVFSFIPLCGGLILMYLFPVWPLFLPSYGLAMFGWSFVLIISRAVPADEIDETSKDSVRKFSMVLMPAFLVDGLSPLLGAYMLNNGFDQNGFLLLGFLGGIIAAIVSFTIIQESLDEDVKERARAGPMIAIRGFGKNYWLFTLGMMGFFFFFNAALPFYGNLAVEEWSIDTATFGLTWSAFSLTSSLFMYKVTGIADRNVKAALIISLFANAVIMLIIGLGNGIVLMFIINIVWALFVAVWIGAERSIIIQDVSDEMKGRAMGTYTMFSMSTSMFAVNFGTWVWTSFGGLRFLWIICSLAETIFIVLVAFILHISGKKDTVSSLE
jgi:MFS family permease